MGSSQAKGGGNLEEMKSPFRTFNARVDRINVDGLGRTKDDIVLEAVGDLFKVSNFEELMTRAHEARTKLERLGCFQSIAINVDTSTGPAATPDYGYQVTYIVRELKTVNGGLQTMVGANNEPSLVASLNAPNLLGRGEQFQGEIHYGTKNTQQLNVNFAKPIAPKYNSRIVGCFFAQSQDWPMSMYKLKENGVALGFQLFSLKNLKHSILWEGIIREINVGNRYAPFNIREQAGSTLKSSIQHTLTYDTRRSSIFPSSGVLSKITSEFAGLGGNVGFLKNDASLRMDIPLFADIVVQASLGGGLLMPIRSGKKTISVCDHFFLGGPVTFRGFDLRGAGPSSDGSSIGAKIYWSGAVSVFTPLPFRPGAGGFGEYFRTHFFANIGNVGDFRIDDGLPGLLHQARLACGVGLALRLANIARVEINCCWPIWTHEGDRPVRGLQIGLATSI